MGAGSSPVGLVPSYKRVQRALSSFLPCEVTEGRQPSRRKQNPTRHQVCRCPYPGFLASRTVRSKCVLEATQLMVFLL